MPVLKWPSKITQTPLWLSKFTQTPQHESVTI